LGWGALRVRDRTFVKRWSDIRGPDVDGGALEVLFEELGAGDAVRDGMVLEGSDIDVDAGCFKLVVGSWRASGCEDSCTALDIDVGREEGFDPLFPGM
jgi:hypothetical protein